MKRSSHQRTVAKNMFLIDLHAMHTLENFDPLKLDFKRFYIKCNKTVKCPYNASALRILKGKEY